MARSRMTTAPATRSPVPVPEIPTGGKPSKQVAEESSIGGAVPDYVKNFVVELAPGYVVERVDDLNWVGKYLRANPGLHGRGGKTAMIWSQIGYFASPSYAFRKLYQIAVASDPGLVSLETFVERAERLVDAMSPHAFAGERVKALAEAADGFRDADVAARLRARAGEIADGTR